MPSIIKNAIKGCTGTVFILEYQLISEEGDSGYSPECACTPQQAWIHNREKFAQY